MRKVVSALSLLAAVYTFDSSGIAPKAAGGTCNTGSSATPAKALFAILLRGPLILNEGN